MILLTSPGMIHPPSTNPFSLYQTSNSFQQHPAPERSSKKVASSTSTVSCAKYSVPRCEHVDFLFDSHHRSSSPSAGALRRSTKHPPYFPPTAFLQVNIYRHPQKVCPRKSDRSRVKLTPLIDFRGEISPQ